MNFEEAIIYYGDYLKVLKFHGKEFTDKHYIYDANERAKLEEAMKIIGITDSRNDNMQKEG